jgi:DNA-binding response OmpR family regulator
MMVESKCKILCVDDHEDSCEVLTMLLSLHGFEAQAVQDMASALERAKENSFKLLILDNRLPDGSGVDLCRKIRSFDKTTPIIFYSALASVQDQTAGLRAGAQAYLTKPVDWNHLLVTINSLIVPYHELDQTAEHLNRHLTPRRRNALDSSATESPG